MGIAKYRQVTEWIQNRIATGELNRGDQIESENDISRTFGISRQTVRHALGLLEQQGILTRIQGSGTFVRDEQAEQEEKKMLSHTVDILTTYVDGYIFPRILQPMVERLEKEGYSARIMFTGNRIETERRLLERIPLPLRGGAGEHPRRHIRPPRDGKTSLSLLLPPRLCFSCLRYQHLQNLSRHLSNIRIPQQDLKACLRVLF